MADTNSLRIRRSITDLLIDHKEGDKAPLDKLIRAWDGIQKLPPDNDNSFFKIAGYHGEPFRGAGSDDAHWWGGYCHHGTVLFPTWHRAYLIRLENALRSIDGCEDVTLPYWNEIGAKTLLSGLPTIFLETTYTFDDGTTIKNPLRSYQFQESISDNQIHDADYSKPVGYETVRYPFSGLVGSKDAEQTKAYNAGLEAKGIAATDKMLNDNVMSWLNKPITTSDGKTIPARTSWKYCHCLRADNYTVFSNTTSASHWNDNKYAVKEWTRSKDTIDEDLEPVVPLESPHNDIHLSVGGFNLPSCGNDNGADARDANGDMGENDTAAFDPLFFFHHCFIDKVFWTWQQIKGCTKELEIMDEYPGTKALEIIDEYPGTKSADDQGPIPDVSTNASLTLKTPLDPFTNKDGTPTTSEVSNRV
jgi:tyrosinase